jgi:hypothetical protein
LCRRHGKIGGGDADKAGDLGWCKEDKKGSIFLQKRRIGEHFSKLKELKTFFGCDRMGCFEGF